MTYDIEQLGEAVESMHSTPAMLPSPRSVLVHEIFEGKPVWEGVVHMFDHYPPINSSRYSAGGYRGGASGE